MCQRVWIWVFLAVLAKYALHLILCFWGLCDHSGQWWANGNEGFHFRAMHLRARCLLDFYPHYGHVGNTWSQTKGHVCGRAAQPRESSRGWEMNFLLSGCRGPGVSAQQLMKQTFQPSLSSWGWPLGFKVFLGRAEVGWVDHVFNNLVT